MQPVDMMECRFGLCDLRRTATDVVLSGDHRLAAVSDALGRVLLVDAWRGITLRIFKGYRDAQCAFVRVPDERHSKHRLGNKVATFLVIYSPKKGTLEMFTVQQGTKIATFSAAKYSRLVYNNYGLMGFTATYRSRHSCPITTVFIDNDGMIKEIMIPFHFALDYKNSKRARDIHLYKKLRQLLKYGDCDTDTLASETLSICTELQTTDLKVQTLEMLLADKSIPAEITLECLQSFLNNLGEGDEKMMESLRIMSENATILLKLYIFSTNGNKASIENKEQSDSANSENGSMVPDYGSTLSPERLSSLQKFVDLNSGNLRVEFDDLKNPSPSQYLSLFEIEHLDSIRLKTNVDDSLLYQVSEMIFKKYIVDNEKKLEELQEQILNCKIVPENLFQLLLHYWINRPNEAGANVLQHMNNLHGVVEILIKTISEEELIPTDNYPSQFWIKIRETLLNSPKLFPALTAAIVFKKLQQNLEISTSDLSIGLDDSVEVWSEEIILWSMLIINLEHVTPLEIILANKSSDQYCKLPKLEYDKFDISLKNILSKGKGSVSELVARWFTLGGVDPELIVINDELYRKAQNPDQSESFSDDGSDTVPKPEIPPHLIEAVEAFSNFKHLNMMKEHFPYSLDASMILANMCWEYALAWQKDIDNLANLEACCTCLNRIPDAHIRKGLYKMVWNTHFKITFESACKVINKAGKIPTERLCRQGTGLSDTQIGTFLRITTNFLDTYLTAFQKADQSPKPTLKFENIWGEASQPLALVELALLQNEINYNLVHLHYQLSYTLELMAAFSIKHSKPINNLFEYYTLGMFFQDFQNEAKINWEYADGRTKASRIQFLHKVISHSIETISVDEKGKTHSGKHYDWMQRCLDIGVVWNIEKSVLKLYEVVQLYNHGFDDIGEFQIKCVYDTQKLGLELLDVACRRLSLFLATDPKITLNVPAFATDVTIYIKKYKGEWCAPSTLRRLEHLARHVVRCMDEEANEHEYKIAVLLLDGVETLRSLRRDVE